MLFRSSGAVVFSPHIQALSFETRYKILYLVREYEGFVSDERSNPHGWSNMHFSGRFHWDGFHPSSFRSVEFRIAWYMDGPVPFIPLKTFDDALTPLTIRKLLIYFSDETDWAQAYRG